MKRALYKKLTTGFCGYCDWSYTCRHKKNGCRHYKWYTKKYAKRRIVLKGENKMDAKDAIEQLEMMATNMIGELAKHKGEYADVIAKRIDAIDMGIEALQKEV